MSQTPSSTLLNGTHWHHGNTLVVMEDNDLRRGVTSLFHDQRTAGHPGISKTLQLLLPYYWWPNMKTFVTAYIRGCTTCQMTKVNTHPLHPPLFPITLVENAHPFETIAMDFIMKLLPSGEYNMILTITDTDCSKASIFLPCKEAIDSEGVAQLYLTHILPHYGLPKKIISDRDPQFTSCFCKELCQLLNIHQNISMAYHPQTDGASERTNQTLKQYLCLFCGTQQNNWHTWLPLVQYTKNSWPSATTKKAPFDLIMGYMPQVHQPSRTSDIPTLGQRLKSIKEAREAAQEAQCKAQETWIKNKPNYKPYVTNDRVWLEGTNLKLPANLTSKLSPRRYGPFWVAAKISNVAYQLELPPQWKIHDIFYTSLLTPYQETQEHGANFIEPPSNIIEGEPEWEIEHVIQSRRFGHNKKKQYLVHWKGYSPLHDSWVNENDMNANDLIADFYNSHPAAIRSCIKAMETTSNSPSPVPPSPCLSAKEHLLRFKLAHFPEFKPAHIPLSPTIMNSSTSSQDNTLLDNKWPSLAPLSPVPLIQVLQLEDSPPPQYSPLAPLMVLHLSGYTPRKMTCISLLLSLIKMNLTSTSTGQPGSQDHMKMPQTLTMKLSKYQQKENLSSEPESNINVVNHQDTHPYLWKNKEVTNQKQAQQPAPR